MSTTITVDDVQRELMAGPEEFELTTSEFDLVTDRAIDGAEDRIEEWLDTSLSVQTTTQELSRPESVDPVDLPLPERPVQSVSSVDIDTWVASDDVSSDDWVAHDTHLELVHDASRDAWPTDRRSITVTWDYGLRSVPEPVRKAIVRLVRRRLHDQFGDGYDSESVGGDSTTYTSDSEFYASVRADVVPFEAPSYYGGAFVL